MEMSFQAWKLNFLDLFTTQTNCIPTEMYNGIFALVPHWFRRHQFRRVSRKMTPSQNRCSVPSTFWPESTKCRAKIAQEYAFNKAKKNQCIAQLIFRLHIFGRPFGRENSDIAGECACARCADCVLNWKIDCATCSSFPLFPARYIHSGTAHGRPVYRQHGSATVIRYWSNTLS